MTSEVLDRKPDAQKQERPPERWRNRWRYRPAYPGCFCVIACMVCGTEQNSLETDFLLPCCKPFPSRDVAETAAAEENYDFRAKHDYLGAEPC